MERKENKKAPVPPLRRVTGFLGVHPCLCMLLVCLCSALFGFATVEGLGMFEFALVWFAGGAALFLGKDKLWENPMELAVMEFIWGGLCVWLSCTDSPAQWWILGGVSALLVLAIYLYSRKRLTDSVSGLLLCAMGYCMRFAYVLITPYTVRHHDVGPFSADTQHAGYIKYLMTNAQLPDFDVRTVSQFYHPPLHHSIAAVWMKFLQGFGLTLEQAGESVQILTLAYSCITLVLFWQLLGHFALKGLAKLLPMVVVTFHPCFFLMGGCINNDMLSITFLLWAILLTCRWYRDPKLSTIIQLALAIGLGMMTKLSVWMAAPAAAVVFLAGLIRMRKQPLPLIRQFVTFGVICVPLGLWWGIRNLVKFGVPLTYIPMLGEGSGQYVGDHTALERLFDFSPYQWTYVYDCFRIYGSPYNEFNPTIGILKTAMFDELINTTTFPGIRGFGELLFFSQVALVLLSLVAIVVVLLKRKTTLEHWQLLLTYGITFISYYSFCLSFKHTCTMNIRYATPLIFIGCLFLGFWLQKGEKAAPTGTLRKVVCIPAALFVLGSYMVYAVVCA